MLSSISLGLATRELALIEPSYKISEAPEVLVRAFGPELSDFSLDTAARKAPRLDFGTEMLGFSSFFAMRACALLISLQANKTL